MNIKKKAKNILIYGAIAGLYILLSIVTFLLAIALRIQNKKSIRRFIAR